MTSSRTENPSLLNKLLVETGTGAVAALTIGKDFIFYALGLYIISCVAPIVTIIDKAITTNASGLEPFKPAIINGVKQFVRKPGQFLRSPAFLWIWAVFSSTYAAANCIDTICEHSETSSFYPKFIGSSIVNVTMSVSKDRAYARMFGKGTPRPISWSTLSLFGIRDGMTILSSFCLPPIISQYLQDEGIMNETTADVTAQLTAPLAIQFLSCPLHLLGLDLYNRPTATLEERQAFIKKEYVSTVTARLSRILPAFGIGGIVNTRLRGWIKSLPSTIEIPEEFPIQ